MTVDCDFVCEGSVSLLLCYDGGMYLCYSALRTTDVLSWTASSSGATSTWSTGEILRLVEYCHDDNTLLLSAVISSRDLSNKDDIILDYSEGVR
jgi:hypothetical protein